MSRMPSPERRTELITPLSRTRARSSRRILEAARSLVQSDGLDGLSMRRLADEAEVSVRTIYNVFGDKHAVIRALVQESFEVMDAAIAASDADDPIDRIWETLAVSIAANCRHVPRAVVLAVVSDLTLNADVAPRWRGRALMEEAFEAGVQGGMFRDDIPAHQLLDQAGPVHAHWLRLWALGAIGDEGLRSGVLYAYDFCLLTAARPQVRTRLLDHMVTLEPRLPTLIQGLGDGEAIL